MKTKFEEYMLLKEDIETIKDRMDLSRAFTAQLRDKDGLPLLLPFYKDVNTEFVEALKSCENIICKALEERLLEKIEFLKEEAIEEILKEFPHLNLKEKNV